MTTVNNMEVFYTWNSLLCHFWVNFGSIVPPLSYNLWHQQRSKDSSFFGCIIFLETMVYGNHWSTIMLKKKMCVCILGCPTLHISAQILTPLRDPILYDKIVSYIDFQSFPASFTIRKWILKFTQKSNKCAKN